MGASGRGRAISSGPDRGDERRVRGICRERRLSSGQVVVGAGLELAHTGPGGTSPLLATIPTRLACAPLRSFSAFARRRARELRQLVRSGCVLPVGGTTLADRSGMGTGGVDG